MCYGLFARTFHRKSYCSSDVCFVIFFKQFVRMKCWRDGATDVGLNAWRFQRYCFCKNLCGNGSMNFEIFTLQIFLSKFVLLGFFCIFFWKCSWFDRVVVPIICIVVLTFFGGETFIGARMEFKGCIIKRRRV